MLITNYINHLRSNTIIIHYCIYSVINLEIITIFNFVNKLCHWRWKQHWQTPFFHIFCTRCRISLETEEYIFWRLNLQMNVSLLVTTTKFYWVLLSVWGRSNLSLEYLEIPGYRWQMGVDQESYRYSKCQGGDK